MIFNWQRSGKEVTRKCQKETDLETDLNKDKDDKSKTRDKDEKG